MRKFNNLILGGETERFWLTSNFVTSEQFWLTSNFVTSEQFWLTSNFVTSEQFWLTSNFLKTVPARAQPLTHSG